MEVSRKQILCMNLRHILVSHTHGISSLGLFCLVSGPGGHRGGPPSLHVPLHASFRKGADGQGNTKERQWPEAGAGLKDSHWEDAFWQVYASPWGQCASLPGLWSLA